MLKYRSDLDLRLHASTSEVGLLTNAFETLRQILYKLLYIHTNH